MITRLVAPPVLSDRDKTHEATHMPERSFKFKVETMDTGKKKADPDRCLPFNNKVR